MPESCSSPTNARDGMPREACYNDVSFSHSRRRLVSLEVPAVNSEFDAEARRPSEPGGADAPARWPGPVCYEGTPGVVTYSYEIRKLPGIFLSPTTVPGVCTSSHNRTVRPSRSGTTPCGISWSSQIPRPASCGRQSNTASLCISTCAASTQRAEDGSAGAGGALAVQAVRRLFNIIRQGLGSRVAVREFQTWESTPKH